MRRHEFIALLRPCSGRMATRGAGAARHPAQAWLIFAFVGRLGGLRAAAVAVARRGLVTVRSQVWNGIRALPWTLAAGCETWDSDSMSQHSSRTLSTTDVLPELTEGDLEKLGMTLGDRKRLIKAIKATAGASPGAPVRSEVGDKATERLLPHGCCRAPSLDRDDLRSGGLDCSVGPTRSGGHGRRDRCLSGRLRPYHARL